MAELALSIARVDLIIEGTNEFIELLRPRLDGYLGDHQEGLRVRFELGRTIPTTEQSYPVLKRVSDSRVSIIQGNMLEIDFDQEARSAVIGLKSRSRREPKEAYFRQSMKSLVALEILRLGGVAMHASAILQEGKVALFAGKSGAGKSTIASFFPPERMLNDDMVGVYLEGDKVVAHSTPFTGTLEIKTNRLVGDVVSAFLLSKGESLSLAPLSEQDNFRAWLQNCSVPGGDPGFDQEAFEVAYGLSKRVQFQKLVFPKSPNEVRAFLDKQGWRLS